MVLLVLIISFGYNQQSFANNSLQDTIQSFNKEEFKASLKELAPKEFARLFAQKYEKDSLKTTICIMHVKNSMLTSEDSIEQYWGYLCLSNWQNNIMNHEESVVNLNKSLQIAKSLNDDNLIMTSLQDRGNSYFDFGEYEKAMEDYLQVLDLAKKTNDQVREQVISLTISLIKMQTNDFPGAIELLNGLLKTIKDDEPKTLHINVYIALTKGYIGIGDYNQAKRYCEKGLELSEKLNDNEAKFYFFSFLGRIASLNQDFEEAHEFIQKSLNIAENLKTIDHEIPVLYIEKGEVFYKEKRYKVAIEFLLKADTLMQKHKLDFIKLEEAYALLAKSYKEVNDIENSLKYYEKANEVYKKNDKRQDNISVDIVKKYDLQSLKEELIAAEESSEKTKNILIVSVFVASFTVIGIVFFFRKREKNNQRKFEELLRSIEEKEKEEKLEAVVEKGKVKKIAKAEIKEVEIIDETKAKLLKKLNNFEAKESYLSKHCSLNEVAKKLKTNTSYLSKLVNAHKGKSFTAYITELRVNYAIKRLKNDKKFRSYTIDSIAQEIGFNRSESFSRAFKNKTGLYPSYYIKSLDNKGVM